MGGKPRRADDYYPTPPCAARALRLWLAKAMPSGQVPWLDPAAGYGALLAELEPDRARRHAIELNPQLAPVLSEQCAHVRLGDSLAMEWTPDCNVVLNPPFGLMEPFHRRAAGYARQHGRVVCMLTRTGYWQAAARNDLPRPSWLLLLTWRPSFDGSGKTDSYSYCWSVFDTEGTDPVPSKPTRVAWLGRPLVSREERDRHRELAARIVCEQPQQFIDFDEVLLEHRSD